MASSGRSIFQNSIYAGLNLQNILYGVELVLYVGTIRVLLSRSKDTRKKSDIFYAVFSGTMAFLVTVWVATSAIFCEEMWLLHDDFPGGADAYWDENLSVWYMDLGTTSVIILQLMTDGLMIHRCRTIWNSYRAIVIPVILWLSTLVLGLLVDWTSSVPGGDFFSGVAAELALWYYTVAVFLNTTLTCMICYRIVQHGMRVQTDIGREFASPYFNVVTIVVESVVPYTLSGIAFLVTFGMQSRTSTAFIGVYFLMMCISPQMLILRVMTGRAWDKDTRGIPPSSLKFSPESGSESRALDGTGSQTRVDLQTLSNVYVPGMRGSRASISQV